MVEASKHFLGKHDFTSFQCSPTDNDNPMCVIERFTVTQESAYLFVNVMADRFLKQMVRSLVGTLVEIGHGKRRPSEIDAILRSTDRRAAGKTAPPHGLYLVEVIY